MNNNGDTQFQDTCVENGSYQLQRDGHLFEIHKHNARELYPIIKALGFREERFFF